MMDENTDITPWMRSKGFPYITSSARVFKWYNTPEQIAEDYGIPVEEALGLPRCPSSVRDVQDPLRIAIHVDCDKSEYPDCLEHDKAIVMWVQSIFGKYDVGVYDDRTNSKPTLVLDIHMPWRDLANIIQ